MTDEIVELLGDQLDAFWADSGGAGLPPVIVNAFREIVNAQPFACKLMLALAPAEVCSNFSFTTCSGRAGNTT
jgi:hypothetical protein